MINTNRQTVREIYEHVRVVNIPVPIITYYRVFKLRP